MPHSSSLEHTLLTGVSGVIQMGLSGNLSKCKNSSSIEIVPQESCETEAPHYAKTRVVDYCTPVVLRILYVVQYVLHHEYLHEKRMGTGR